MKDPKRKQLDLGPPIDPAKPLFSQSCDPRREPDRWAREYSENEARLLQPVLGEAGLSSSVFDLRQLRHAREQIGEQRAQRRRAAQAAAADAAHPQRPGSAPPPGGLTPLSGPAASPLTPASLAAPTPPAAPPAASPLGGGQRRRVPPPASLRAPSAPPRPLRSASPGPVSPKRYAAAPLDQAAGSPRQGQSICDAATRDELAALLHCARPLVDYAETLDVDCSGTDLSWLVAPRGEGEPLAQPGEMTTLLTLRDAVRPGAINSPRSVLVLMRAGVTAAELRARPASDFASAGATQEEVAAAHQHSEQRRAALLDMLLADYRQLCTQMSFTEVLDFYVQCPPPDAGLAASSGASPTASPRSGSRSPAALRFTPTPTFLRRQRERGSKLLAASRDLLQRQVQRRAADEQAQLQAAALRLEQEQQSRLAKELREQQRVAQREQALRQRDERIAHCERVREMERQARWNAWRSLAEREEEREMLLGAMQEEQRARRASRGRARLSKWEQTRSRSAALEAERIEREAERQRQRDEALAERLRAEEQRRVARLDGSADQKRLQRKLAAAHLAAARREELQERRRELEGVLGSRLKQRGEERRRQRWEEMLTRDDKNYYVLRRARAKKFREACLLGAIHRKRQRVAAAAALKGELAREASREREAFRLEKEHRIQAIQRRAETVKLGLAGSRSPSPGSAARER
eukprot:TRINITY_DN8443_c0_g2_i1.p1 TRINITY_DN8443_c0_g2~~TRINITY_DN8443_c0_g2_i1.p1  ORF type:complete len:724 (+),score=290.29 TRINITY_DN8443_c0_g2_i1:83-2173(+)